MANPNILAASSIYGNTSYLTLSANTATTWTALTPAVSTVYKLEGVTASNTSGSTANITMSINSAISGGGTAYRIVYQVLIPTNSSLIIIDKTNPLYVTETQSIVATANVSVDLVATYESIT